MIEFSFWGPAYFKHMHNSKPLKYFHSGTNEGFPTCYIIFLEGKPNEWKSKYLLGSSWETKNKNIHQNNWKHHLSVFFPVSLLIEVWLGFQFFHGTHVMGFQTWKWYHVCFTGTKTWVLNSFNLQLYEENKWLVTFLLAFSSLPDMGEMANDDFRITVDLCIFNF